jgi:hypothetical protein
MKWYPSILEVEKADELKALSKVLYFVLSLGSAVLKEGCKFRWSEEDRVLKQKHKIKRETQNHLTNT